MTVNDALSDARIKMGKTVEALKDDFLTISAGRANPALFSKVIVDYYGTPTPVQHMATFQVQDARTILIVPFDASALGTMEKALRDTEFGGNPANDGKTIRIVLPELTQERRKEYVKIVRGKAENSRVAVRNSRRAAKEAIDKLVKNKEIGEDEGSAGQKELELLTKKQIDLIDEILKNKEAELQR